MGLQRYEWYYAGMDEDSTGDWVRLEDVIKLLEKRLTGCGGYECETCDEVSGIIRAIALIKREK